MEPKQTKRAVGHPLFAILLCLLAALFFIEVRSSEYVQAVQAAHCVGSERVSFGSTRCEDLMQQVCLSSKVRSHTLHCPRILTSVHACPSTQVLNHKDQMVFGMDRNSNGHCAKRDSIPLRI